MFIFCHTLVDKKRAIFEQCEEVLVSSHMFYIQMLRNFIAKKLDDQLITTLELPHFHCQPCRGRPNLTFYDILN